MAQRGGCAYLAKVRLALRDRIEPRIIDLAIALALTVAGQASIWAGTTDEGPKALTVPVALVVTLGLAWRRRMPALVAGTAGAPGYCRPSSGARRVPSGS
jgi:hypothetical protein